MLLILAPILSILPPTAAAEEFAPAIKYFEPEQSDAVVVALSLFLPPVGAIHPRTALIAILR